MQAVRCGMQAVIMGCKVWEAGYRMQAARCRIKVEGCKMQNEGCRVQAAGCRLQEEGCGMKDAGQRLMDTECRFQVAGCRRMQDEGCGMQDESSRIWAGDDQVLAATSPLPGTVAGEFSLGFLFWVAKISSGTGISSDSTGFCARPQHEAGKEDHTARPLPGRLCHAV